ncbi:nitroreductase family protein [Proteiniclasticum ruminis]|uniref:Putative nitroreductase TM1586 domain-containing protein n=1 Tax=Proteiniclasticum ruminis TaxID=398199 RepID=A0A1I5CHW0_9CLOT|nr:nitroreductase family protein [Proteiniclasticum ruminis]SFN86600.1 hypothetical protein SAMN04488695_106133 [Proteiniclasticum ruminis]
MTKKWIKEDIMKLIEQRKSIRTFEERPLTEADRKEIRDFLESSENPFHVKVEFRFLESLENTTNLGTYGVIKGASSYLGAMVKDGPLALEALGYEMERLMLFLVSKNIGTCWLGGTFKREDFKEAMVVPEGYLFPAITPVGYEKVEKSLTDRLVRFIAKGNQRKPFEELFFKDSFQNSYPKEDKNLLSDLLEMVRLGPSASNKQPWRILVEDHVVHFYEKKTPRYSDAFPYDIQRLDLGIAACHFHLGALERNLQGEFITMGDGEKDLGKETLYRFSYLFK